MGVLKSSPSMIAIAPDGVGVGTGIVFGVRLGVCVGVRTRIDGRCAERGCADYVVIFFAGSNAERGIAWQFSGHIPVFRNAD